MALNLLLGAVLIAVAGAISNPLYAQTPETSGVSISDKDRTQIGATLSGNIDDSIPPYIGDAIPIPDDWRPGLHYADPFPNDEPDFSISAENLGQYESKLASGQKALFKRHKRYRLPVYQSRRTARYPVRILEGTAHNSKNTKLINHGNGLKNLKEGFPFPVLDNDNQTAALQAVWNHIARYRGGNIERTVIQATVFDNGDFVPVKLYQRYTRAENLNDKPDIEDDNILFYYLDRITSPARLSGTTLLVHETLDQSAEYRRAWLYDKAYKRVRRVPGAAYDTPVPGTYGLRTADSYDMFNGSPDKYQWRYLGKQELYIPYNAYRLASSKLNYTDLLTAATISADHQRWELHRVHKIEAVLREGQRHIYAKRVFYLDEDSWTIVLAEHYDNHGELWRISEGHLINYYDQNLPYFAMEVTYDLIDNRYNVFGLSNEESSAYTFDKRFQRNDYSPSALRRYSRN